MFLRLFASYIIMVIVSDALICLLLLHRSTSDQIQQLLPELLIAASFSWFLALLPAYYLARRFVEPVHILTDGARRIAGGDYAHKIYVGGVGENQALARTFNEMSNELAFQFEQLQTDREQLRAILSGMVEGVVAIDPEQRILFANDRAGELLDFSATDAVNRKFWEVVRHRQILQVMERAGTVVDAHREEIDWIGPGVKNLAIYVARLPGEPSHGTVMVLHDTTKLRQLERLRQDFVANVTHELNTPLSVIKACIEALLDGAVEQVEARGQFMEQIAGQADRLHALILDLLSLARIESNRLDLQITAVPITWPVQEAVDRHRMRAESKTQELVVETELESELLAWADEDAVGQILDNLIDNAVKYTPSSGQIRIRWFAIDAGHIALEVEDNGIGIPEADLPRVFERFYRVDKGRSRDVGGTGLGLAIVKHFVQALNGTIRASSRYGFGTTFTVILPRAPSH